MNYDENNVESNTAKADKTKFAHFSHRTKNSVLLFAERKIFIGILTKFKIALCLYLHLFLLNFSARL